MFTGRQQQEIWKETKNPQQAPRFRQHHRKIPYEEKSGGLHGQTSQQHLRFHENPPLRNWQAGGSERLPNWQGR